MKVDAARLAEHATLTPRYRYPRFARQPARVGFTASFGEFFATSETADEALSALLRAIEQRTGRLELILADADAPSCR